ncbi:MULTISPECIES: carboxylesterase/lipase family protein [unclassified Nocardioides]|uniref:carboxylesterase/lipase family protein n=1 Tax=unclassified Nocardioides TaxID=2615069 RepID=UPI001296A527|nr:MULTISPECIES: carboxylesterase family protein [unclassified Nocardioides]
MRAQRWKTWRVAVLSAALATAVTVPASALVSGAPGEQRSSSSSPGREAFRGQHPVVRTDKGLVRGEAAAMVTSFKGIPYAAPPVRDLRWRAPRPARAWSGVRDATEFGGSCVQGTGWDPGYDQPTLTEDCLYLNVYRPSGSRSKNLPVFVWNHGGGNVGGAGRDTDPSKFVTRRDVVYVTINYRIGAMGWLDTPALEADNRDGSTGNFGLLDQQAALRWVQRNIRSFGGDPNNVTLAGQSAGASNTVAQLASPGARGLFDRAALHSGGGNPARTLEAARTSGERFAAELGCTDPATQVACLRAASPAEVLAAQTTVRQSGPVAGTRVLPRDPVELMKARRLTDLPVIVGANSDESQQSVFGAYDYVGNPITPEMFDELVTTTYGEQADRVRAAYQVEDYFSPTVAWGDVQSDQRACRDQTLRDRLGADTRTYAYEFAEQDGPPFTSIWLLDTDYPFGATHVNELGYLWDYLGTSLPLSTDQLALSDQMISYWGEFARDGSPDPRYAPQWPRYRPQGRMLQFTAPTARVVTHAAIDAQHGCALWDEVAPAP